MWWLTIKLTRKKQEKIVIFIIFYFTNYYRSSGNPMVGYILVPIAVVMIFLGGGLFVFWKKRVSFSNFYFISFHFIYIFSCKIVFQTLVSIRKISICYLRISNINFDLLAHLSWIQSKLEFFWFPVVRGQSVHLSVWKLFPFSSSPPEQHGKYQQNIAQSIPV